MDLVTAERREMSALLTDLPESAWDAPSLCAGWRVREVVAHMTMPFRSSPLAFLLGMVRARGDFNKASDRWARDDAAKFTSAELAASMRENAGNRWKPPGGGFAGALGHDVVHGLDVTVALGLDRDVPAERLAVVLGGPGAEKGRKYFGVDLHGIELRATDLGWSLGSGKPLEGKAQHLLLVTSGRVLPPGLLKGEDAGRFTAG